MKIWIDAQISPSIAAWVNRTFPNHNAESVRALGLRDALDKEIYFKARDEGAIVMSKDQDFIRMR